VESGVKYVRRNFLCGLLGKEPVSLEELNARLREWVHNIANRRVHGTTHEEPAARWPAERSQLRSVNGRPPYPYVDEELRRVARDAYVSWQGSRYSVPWSYVGKDVWVCERGSSLEIHHGADRIALHERAGRHRVVTHAEHHRGIPLGSRHRGDKILVHLRETAPVVEVRSLAAYENAAAGVRP
jgi:hypothetical protein